MTSTAKDNGVVCGFVYVGEVIAADGTVLQRQEAHNVIPQNGIDYLASLVRGLGTMTGTWYMGLFEGNYLPTGSTLPSDLPSNAKETTVYSEATRPVWNESYDGVSIIGNINSRAEYTFPVAKRVYGGFLSSQDLKGGSGGTLLSIARFASPFDIPAGTAFRLGTSITLLPAS